MKWFIYIVTLIGVLPVALLSIIRLLGGISAGVQFGAKLSSLSLGEKVWPSIVVLISVSFLLFALFNLFGKNVSAN